MEEQIIPVLVSLQAIATSNGDEPEVLSLMTAGELQKTSNGYTLRYEETMHEGTTPTLVELTLEKGVINMRRKGEYEVNMVFQKGQRYEGQYHTPFGTLDLALFSTKADFKTDEQDGEIRLQYQLDINGQFVAVHQLELFYSAREGGA